MSRKTTKLAAFGLLMALAACEPRPYLPADYAAPAPPPLQPYMGPPAAPYVATVNRRRVVRHYRRYHRRVHCRCAPAR